MRGRKQTVGHRGIVSPSFDRAVEVRCRPASAAFHEYQTSERVSIVKDQGKRYYYVQYLFHDFHE